MTQGKPVCSRMALVAAGKDGCLDVGSVCAVPDTELPEAVFVLPCLKQERLCKDSGCAKNNRIFTLKPYRRVTDTNYLSTLKCSNSYSQIQQLFMHTSIAKHNLRVEM